jgi:hypothetical protein
MSRGWRITVMAVSAAGIVSTPLIWLLDNPDAGQLVGASVQGATGIGALVWALFQPSPAAAPVPHPQDAAVDTGKAEAVGGASASSGVRRRGRRRGSASAQRTGDARAEGRGSSASTGVEYL